MNKCKFWNYIISFIKEQEINFNEDFGDLLSQQLKALFTSYCLIFGIDADTSECDACLRDISDLVKVDENYMGIFENFMLGYLV